jgi:hypothetical protein
MIYKIIFFIALSYCAWADDINSDYWFINISNVLKSYGFTDGVLDTNYNYVKVVNDAVISAYGINEAKIVLNTPEEFISAAYFFPIIIQRLNQKQSELELPHNKDGQLRLLSLWVNKRQNNPGVKAYVDSVTLLNCQFNFKESEIMDYYSNIIKNKLDFSIDKSQ